MDKLFFPRNNLTQAISYSEHTPNVEIFPKEAQWETGTTVSVLTIKVSYRQMKIDYVQQ